MAFGRHGLASSALRCGASGSDPRPRGRVVQKPRLDANRAAREGSTLRCGASGSDPRPRGRVVQKPRLDANRAAREGSTLRCGACGSDPRPRGRVVQKPRLVAIARPGKGSALRCGASGSDPRPRGRVVQKPRLVAIARPGKARAPPFAPRLVIPCASGTRRSPSRSEDRSRRLRSEAPSRERDFVVSPSPTRYASLLLVFPPTPRTRKAAELRGSARLPPTPPRRRPLGPRRRPPRTRAGEGLRTRAPR